MTELHVASSTMLVVIVSGGAAWLLKKLDGFTWLQWPLWFCAGWAVWVLI